MSAKVRFAPLVVYAIAFTRTERDEKTGEDIEHEIPYMKGYTVFNVEQIESLPEIYYSKAVPTLDSEARIENAEKFFGSLGATIRQAETEPTTTGTGLRSDSTV